MTVKGVVYYNSSGLRTKNRFLNLVISARGVGKTYDFKKRALIDFAVNGNQFLYLTRFANDLDFLVDTAFDDVATDPDLAEYEITQKGLKVFVKGKMAGEIAALSQDSKIKKVSRPRVTTIIYDEFLQEKGARYLAREPRRLLGLASTIFRRRSNCKIYCLANAVELVNPYFEYFGIMPNPSKRFNLYKSMAVEFPPADDFYNEDTELTPLEELMMATDYGDYAMSGKFEDNNSTLLKPKLDKTDQAECTIIYNGKHYGIWLNPYENIITVSSKYDPGKPSFTVTLDDLNEIGAYKGWYELGIHNRLQQVSRDNKLYFETIQVRKNAIEFLKKMNVY